MTPQETAYTTRPRKPGLRLADAVRRRRGDDGEQAPASPDATAPAGRVVALWRRTVDDAETQLVPYACRLAALDLATGLSACYAPLLTPLLSLIRLAALVVLVPAGLRVLLRARPGEDGTRVLQRLTLALAAAALYLLVRTSVVVGICSS